MPTRSDLDLRADLRTWTAWQLVDDQSAMPLRLNVLGDAIRALRPVHREALFVVGTGAPMTALMRRYRLQRRQAADLTDRALAALRLQLGLAEQQATGESA